MRYNARGWHGLMPAWGVKVGSGFADRFVSVDVVAASRTSLWQPCGLAVFPPLQQPFSLGYLLALGLDYVPAAHSLGPGNERAAHVHARALQFVMHDRYQLRNFDVERRRRRHQR